MLHFLPGPLKGVLAASLIALNTLFWFLVFIPITLLKLLPLPALRHGCSLLLIRCAEIWVHGNSGVLHLTQNTRWDVQGLEDLDLQASYLVISNHRSWTDIFVLQHLLRGRIPFLKFFLKKELIWVPLLGLTWWALDFPFMKRYSREFLKKNPHLRGKDMETTQKYCERFKKYPVSIINFLEGTRFKERKRQQQGVDYRHLLRPKAGGVALVLSAMGSTLKEVLDVTLIYPENEPKGLFWGLLSGKIPQITARIQRRPLPANTQGRDYLEDEAYRNEIQNWVNQIWSEKEAQIDQLLQAYAQRDQEEAQSEAQNWDQQHAA